MNGHRRRALTIATAVALVVAGCSSGGDPATRDAADDATAPGGTVTDASTGEPPDAETEDSVDPSDSAADSAAEELYPDVVGVEAEQSDDGTWTFRVTLSSPYDTPERYADAWRVEAPDGTVLGTRQLAHDHQNEQPFTRATSGVEIPEELDVVVVRGRDQLSGWSPDAMEYEVPR